MEQDFKKISNEIVELLVKKNSDYGSDNLKKFGLFGILVRLSDKMERLRNLIYKDVVKSAKCDETIRETFIDIAGYAINAIRLLDGDDL